MVDKVEFFLPTTNRKARPRCDKSP